MKRGDADRIFTQAFDGDTVDEVLFKLRTQMYNKDTWDTAKGRSDEALMRKMGQYNHRYTATDLPDTHIDFLPWRGMQVPEGVTFKTAPPPVVPVGSICDKVTEENVDMPTANSLEYDYASLESLDSQALSHEQKEKERMNPTGQGQLWSWHRPA